MGARTDKFMGAAVNAAKKAKQWAKVAAREADRLLVEARTRAESAARRKKRKATLEKVGRVLRTAGRAALVAAVAAGVAATRAEHRTALPKRRGR